MFIFPDREFFFQTGEGHTIYDGRSFTRSVLQHVHSFIVIVVLSQLKRALEA